MAKLEVFVVSPIETKALKKYLESKCISMRLADKYCFEAIIYCEKRHQNLHHIGFFSNNFGFIYKSSWGMTGSRNVGITTITKNGVRCIQPTHQVVLVFSGFMDFLSYLTLKGLDEPECDVLILNGCSNVEKGMRFLRQHLYVFCYLSLDERGRKCQKYIENTLNGNLIVDRSDRYGGAEDLNGLLVKTMTEETASASAPRRRKSKSKKADK